ncbi:uncharacterized protein K452DRAFT_223453 [Aplosporella prunicola CBS 121167]|uniref:DUF1793-domain-containing protein n=1 Tax=Aplosporella prunicola CBS 121167 TaxID=1176127 RepID=A0A6A6BL24_9PEZI|nr:uncharacterized protein K452DRAFT_223453 [Aplosporella prunicola CBS 121167]KAF2144083.1 hypothetical protein K452DRAFT_223453 [Aplosporella prunicola CBS 121167]
MIGSKAATFSPITPPSFPLAVKNPYLSAWLPGNQAADLPSAQPEFWYANKLTWSVLARVDGDVYNLFGVPSPEDGTQSATVVSGNYTATHSIFSLTAGSASITLDFFSPISVDNLVRQSYPFSYLTVSVSGVDGASPSVQIYSDIDDTWTGQSEGTTITHTADGATTLFELEANVQKHYSEADEMAQWGQAIYAARTDSYQAGTAAAVRGQFIKNGTLANSTESAAGNVVGFAQDLGSVSSSQQVVFVVGYVREDAIDYRGTAYTPYYRSAYPKTIGAVSRFLDIHDDAVTESESFDAQVVSVGDATGGSNYTAILELSTRQIFGGIDITIEKSSLDTSEPWAFIKEISSNGNLNTIDIIFPTFPFFYMFAPNWIKYLLDPTLTYLESGAYPHPYVIHDLGTHYPNSTGHDEGLEEAMPIEETGNLMVLALAHKQATGDASIYESHTELFKGYADYLVDNGLYPTNQFSTNDGLGKFTNMTNLGVKAAVGLAAYGELSGSTNYTDKGKEFAGTIWEGLGTAVTDDTETRYFTLTYGNSTWFLTFNLYADKLLGLEVFDDEVYTAQSAFYPTVRDEWGVAIEGAVVWAKTDWQMWTAAFSEEGTQEMFINDLYAFIANGKNTAPFGDRYWTSGANAGETAQSFRARPTLGAHFAVAALKQGVLSKA